MRDSKAYDYQMFAHSSRKAVTPSVAQRLPAVTLLR